jgi:hypothetical protein
MIPSTLMADLQDRNIGLDKENFTEHLLTTGLPKYTARFDLFNLFKT